MARATATGSPTQVLGRTTSGVYGATALPRPLEDPATTALALPGPSSSNPSRRFSMTFPPTPSSPSRPLLERVPSHRPATSDALRESRVAASIPTPFLDSTRLGRWQTLCTNYLPSSQQGGFLPAHHRNSPWRSRAHRRLPRSPCRLPARSPFRSTWLFLHSRRLHHLDHHPQPRP